MTEVLTPEVQGTRSQRSATKLTHSKSEVKILFFVVLIVFFFFLPRAFKSHLRAQLSRIQHSHDLEHKAGLLGTPGHHPAACPQPQVFLCCLCRHLGSPILLLLAAQPPLTGNIAKERLYWACDCITSRQISLWKVSLNSLTCLQGEIIRMQARDVHLQAGSLCCLAVSSRGSSKWKLLMWFYASVYLRNLN